MEDLNKIVDNAFKQLMDEISWHEDPRDCYLYVTKDELEDAIKKVKS